MAKARFLYQEVKLLSSSRHAEGCCQDASPKGSDSECCLGHVSFPMSYQLPHLDPSGYITSVERMYQASRVIPTFCWSWQDMDMEGPIAGYLGIFDWHRAFRRRKAQKRKHQTYGIDQLCLKFHRCRDSP